MFMDLGLRTCGSGLSQSGVEGPVLGAPAGWGILTFVAFFLPWTDNSYFAP